MSEEIKCKTGNWWGAPCLKTIDGDVLDKKYNELQVLLMDEWFDFELLPVGSESSMGHGCGSGYSDAKLSLSNGYELTGNVTVRVKDLKK